ncbi:MAG: hypothetical protein JWM11_6687 [Planctomycetaceae bacterium]|nr:hypothetical protein [Planctomycetaceae bacterium]
MASEQFLKTVTAVAERLVLLAADDVAFREQLRQLAQSFLDATAPHSSPAGEISTQVAELPPDRADTDYRGDEVSTRISVTTTAPATISIETDRLDRQSEEILTDNEPAVSELLTRLTLGQRLTPSSSPAVTYPTRFISGGETDLGLIELRCRLKAEGCRWAATRRRLIADGAHYATEIEPKDRDIIARAKALTDCYLWMCQASGPAPSDLKLYEDVASCFEAIAEVLAVIRTIQDNSDAYQTEFEKSLDLLAEAQSALRVAVTRLEYMNDHDQLQVYNWLRNTAQTHQIFIRRFMRADDLGDPARSSDLISRVEAIDARLQESKNKEKKRKKLLGKIRHKLSEISNHSPGSEANWPAVIEIVEELVNDGMAPSNRELREMLAPVVEDWPEVLEVPRGFQMVIREIDRFLATCPPPSVSIVAQPSTEVREVARLLKGKTIILLGGDRRPHAYDSLKEAFGLKELIWIETREHESLAAFIPYVARSEVAVVLLAIRWASHSYGEIKKCCEEYGKPMVRLPGGYNANQVAMQIVQQCSGQLRTELEAVGGDNAA